MSVRFWPKADKRSDVSLRPLCAKSGHMQRNIASARPPKRGGSLTDAAIACALRSRTRMLFGRGAGNPLLGGGRGFRPVRGCRNHMNDLVAAAFELVKNFGQRKDGARVNVVQQQDALAARLDTADGTLRNLATVDAGPVVRQEIRAPSHIAMGREVLLDRLLAQQTRYPKERRYRLRVPDGLAQRLKTLLDFARRLIHR